MKLPASFYNMVSYVGATIAGVSFLLILFMMILTSIVSDMGSYMGIIIFMILPAILVFGLLLIPFGMWLQVKKAKRTHKTLIESRFILDLNKKQHRNASVIFLIGTVIFLLFTAVGSYELYHYSESVEFCGTICHEVMKPEYVAYQNSPHAKVTCAQCHIGSGAGWFVKSKISGLYQVYAVLTNNVPRPIPTPIANLRPARETCEQCHWPQKFYENSLRSEKYYLTDEANTEWEMQMRMKIGPSHSAQGQTEGIHWHINPNVKIEYISTDEKREVIPWVRYINQATGDTIIYQDQYEPLEEGAADSLALRTMDCMDCHNRPSHNYQTPTKFINHQMAAGTINADLPEIKRLTMELLAGEFTHTDSALKTIETTVWNFYMENYPDVFTEKEQSIKEAVLGIQNAFAVNIFPEMNAKWDAYPSHIGHMEFNGCFRCHNDQHSADNGKIISKDCNLCHSIMSQGTGETLDVARFDASLEFKHPVDIDEAWKESLCSDCHRYMY
ncbi:MAG: cytochrome C [Bacteroidetes bacterium HGW-Bacteroidetes-4]|jgi:nitrate/TMAO reductase-like tetraheme cytochrome c subunit|nr:MAG: cytochrome C [Bacteroidetes bacterium HGW-Bacteroidetes-4]